MQRLGKNETCDMQKERMKGMKVKTYKWEIVDNGKGQNARREGRNEHRYQKLDKKYESAQPITFLCLKQVGLKHTVCKACVWNEGKFIFYQLRRGSISWKRLVFLSLLVITTILHVSFIYQHPETYTHNSNLEEYLLFIFCFLFQRKEQYFFLFRIEK